MQRKSYSACYGQWQAILLPLYKYHCMAMTSIWPLARQRVKPLDSKKKR
jgi:hypothetical protein